MRRENSCLWIIRTFIVTFMLVAVCNACTCVYHHPQEHYCSSDFVALVKVKQKGKSDGMIKSYHIKVKKEFKMSEKARHALSHGLIWTSAHDSLCGVTLKPTRYVISVTLNGEKPWISICSLVMEWSTLSNKQRKGFRRLYQQGCHCKIKKSFTFNKTTNWHCNWETVMIGRHDCQSLHSVCAPSPHHSNHCVWVKNSAYRHCMKERQAIRDREP